MNLTSLKVYKSEEWLYNYKYFHINKHVIKIKRQERYSEFVTSKFAQLSEGIMCPPILFQGASHFILIR